jgi:hypothetical protein
MAVGRTRALLGYGVAHFVVYVGAVFAVATLGLPAVALVGSVVHFVFLVVAYEVLLRGLVRSPIRVLWQDLAPATVACVALFALALPASLGLGASSLPPLAEITGVTFAGAVGYLTALRIWFPASAHDLAAAIRRILPSRISLPRMRRPAFGES